MFDVVIAIDESEETPIYQQICHGIREAILAGKLPPGTALPSARVLSRKLGVSRFTVHHSLELLCAQGYLETSRGKAVVLGAPASAPSVTPVLSPAPAVNEYQLTEFAQSALASQEVKMPAALQYQATSAELLPFKSWRQLLLKHLRREDLIGLARTQDSAGLPALRQAIADYLQRTRSVICSAEQVIIFPGPTACLDFLARLLLAKDTLVAVENPGFRHVRRVFSVHGAHFLPIDVDANGMMVENLIGTNQPVKIAYLNPSAQDPTGAVLSLRRRQELISWAKANNALLIEDDFGREYRYATRPVPSLQGLSAGDGVIYLSSFWTVLFPLTRVSFAVVPPNMVLPANGVRQLLERDVSALDQCVLTEFLAHGHLERYVRRMRTVYLKRRQALIKVLIQQFGREIAITQESAAMHVVLRFKRPVDNWTIQSAAEAVGLPLTSTAPYYLQNPIAGEFLISFAQLDEQAIEDGVKAWRQTLSASAQLT